jgi:hypothetical protein
MPEGTAKRHAVPVKRRLGQELTQALPAFARHYCLFPRADGLLDRSKRSGKNDRPRDHAAGAQLVPENKHGTCRKDGDLNEEAQELAHGGDKTGLIAGCLLHGQDVAVHPVPGDGERRRHRHAVDNFGVAEGRLDAGKTLRLHGARLLERGSGQMMIEHGTDEKQHRTGKRHMAQPDMQQIDKGDIDRYPGRIEQGNHAAARQEGPERSQVAQRFAAIGLPAHRILKPTCKDSEGH